MSIIQDRKTGFNEEVGLQREAKMKSNMKQEIQDCKQETREKTHLQTGSSERENIRS